MARTIGPTLQSALGQTHGDFEVLVVDNGSTDGTFELAARVCDRRLRIYRNTRNLGAYGNHNRCIELAAGQWLKFLHGDDELLPDCLSRFNAALEGIQAEVGLLACGAIRVDGHRRELSRTAVVSEPFTMRSAGVLEFALTGNIVGTPTMTLIRRECIIAVGGFDLALEPAADNDCWIALRKRFWSKFLPEYLVMVRDDPPQSLAARCKAGTRECIRVGAEINKWWKDDARWSRQAFSATPYASWMRAELSRFLLPSIKYLLLGRWSLARCYCRQSLAAAGVGGLVGDILQKLIATVFSWTKKPAVFWTEQVRHLRI
jgi:glycosyltransferase involved in cell wall biosynthesis